jgi:hypothetical protein
MGHRILEHESLKGIPLQERDVHTLMLTFCRLAGVGTTQFLTFREAWRLLDFDKVFEVPRSLKSFDISMNSCS